MNRKIEYKGQVLETTKYKEITDNEYYDIVNEYYNKPNINEVKEQFKTIEKAV